MTYSAIVERLPGWLSRYVLHFEAAIEDAVARFQPYDKIREENPETRDALREWIRRMREERRAARTARGRVSGARGRP